MSLSVDKPQKILIKNTMLCIWLQSRSIKHQRYIDQCCRVTERELDDPSSCKAGNWQIYRLCCQLQSLLMWEKSGSLSNWIINCKKKPIWTCNQKTSFIPLWYLQHYKWQWVSLNHFLFLYSFRTISSCPVIQNFFIKMHAIHRTL